MVRFLGYLWNPLSWAMEVAAILAIILLDYADFALVRTLSSALAVACCSWQPCLASPAAFNNTFCVWVARFSLQHSIVGKNILDESGT